MYVQEDLRLEVSKSAECRASFRLSEIGAGNRTIDDRWAALGHRLHRRTVMPLPVHIEIHPSRVPAVQTLGGRVHVQDGNNLPHYRSAHFSSQRIVGYKQVQHALHSIDAGCFGAVGPADQESAPLLRIWDFGIS